MELKKEPSKTLIYVSNLPFETTDEQFRDLFKGFTVKTAYVAKRKNGRSKGFGFANLEKESEQSAAIEKLNGFDLNSRKLIAKVAMNDDRRDEKGELKEEFKSQLPPRSTPSETVAHVSNLEWTVNDEELRKIFAEFNPKVATVATRRNGRSKGFGFVEFNTKDDLEKAVKLNGTTVSGRQIIVQVSVKRTSTPNNRRNNNNNNNNRGGNNNNNSRSQNRNTTRRNNSNSNNNNNNNNRGGNNNNRGGNSNNNFNVVRRTERNTENTLYISNLPFELDDNDLKQIFQEFQPKTAHIPLRRNGKSRGYGFVEFTNSRDQTEALRALDQSEVNGRVVTIKVSSPNANNNRVTVNRRNNNNNNNRGNNSNNNRGGNNNNRRNNNNNNNNNNNRGGNNNNNNNNNRNTNSNRNNNRRQQQPRENREISSNLVYVSNLPFNLEDNGLGEIFKGLKINKAYVARRRNGYSKGFGFVEFASTEDQQKAIKQNGSEVSGRPIVVQAAFKVDEKTN